MAQKLKLTFAGFAHDIGAHARITQDVSQVWHDEYVNADETTRKARREEFIRNFLIGYGLPEKRAVQVMEQSRDDRTAEDQKAYDAARAKFTYHIVRPEKGGKGSASADLVAQALKLVEKMTAAQKRKFLAAL